MLIINGINKEWIFVLRKLKRRSVILLIIYSHLYLISDKEQKNIIYTHSQMSKDKIT